MSHDDAAAADPGPPVDDPEPTELVAATYAATLADEWWRQGLRHAVVCPGSRSTPIALALAAHDGIAVHVYHDERAGGFAALGLGRATGRAAVVVTTSGTAAVELHPAVVEADHGGVPLLAVTADRPPELRGVGAPQTIDQRELYGPSVRWFGDPGPPDARGRAGWRDLAADALAATRGPVPGPVHLNVAFREPLVGPVGALPPADDARTREPGGVPEMSPDQVERLMGELEDRNGVIVAGSGAAVTPEEAAAVAGLAARLGWPVLADHASGCRAASPDVVVCFDGLLRDDALARHLRPEVVLRLGGLLASRVTNEWLAGSGATQFAIDRTGRAPDPDGVVTERFWAVPGDACALVSERIARLDLPLDGRWLARWREVDRSALVAVDGVLGASGELTEPGAARAALAAVPPGGTLVVSSSMPVRDLEWYVPGRDDARVVANRGANGIDGVLSTAVGVALAGGPVVCLLGDVALVHDSSGLVALARRGVDLAIVVVDNDGGGIFSFLPQARAVEGDRFEQLFGTPHATDLVALAGAHGIAATTVSTHAGLEAALVGWRDRGGPLLVVARSDRATNAALHAAMNAAVVAAVS